MRKRAASALSGCWSLTKEGAQVSVKGKVKFFNDSKGFAYADLIGDLAELA